MANFNNSLNNCNTIQKSDAKEFEIDIKFLLVVCIEFNSESIYAIPPVCPSIYFCYHITGRINSLIVYFVGQEQIPDGSDLDISYNSHTHICSPIPLLLYINCVISV